MIKTAAVYLGSKSGITPDFAETAKQMGQALAAAGIAVVYGGTNIGTMTAMADGALNAGGKVTGVIPQTFDSRSITNDKITKCIKTKDLKERKEVMESLSQAAIILPGSYGTMDELFEYAVNNQLGKLNRPIFILNHKGFFNPLLQQLDIMVERGFLTKELREMMHNCTTPQDVIKGIEEFNSKCLNSL